MHPLDSNYRWTFGLFLTGFIDWLRERQVKGPSRQGSKSKQRTVKLVPMLAGAFGLLLVLWSASVLFAPLAAEVSGSSGASVLLVVASLLLLLVFGWVAVGLWKRARQLTQFIHEMGLRGWEIKTGRRVPIRGVV